MKKVHVQNLAIETTRRCNMQCAHCLRGPAQNKDMPYRFVRSMLDQCASINEIVFTGGEPTLNVDIIKDTLEYCKKQEIPVNYVYVVTNGKTVPDAFLHVMIDWFVYCMRYDDEAEEFMGVSLSHDAFHEKIPSENIAKLKALSFFRTDDHEMKENHQTLQLLGRAVDLKADGYEKATFHPPIRETLNSDMISDYGSDGNLVVDDITLALTVDGDVLQGCDYQYDQTEDLTLCHVEDFAKTIERIKREGEKIPCDKEDCLAWHNGMCSLPALTEKIPYKTDTGCQEYRPDR